MIYYSSCGMPRLLLEGDHLDSLKRIFGLIHTPHQWAGARKESNWSSRFVSSRPIMAAYDFFLRLAQGSNFSSPERETIL